VVEQALRESEERYRNLFNSMEEGFCIIEMIFDAEGRPADYRFLKVNAAFERQTGLHDAEGKLMRDLAPDHEAHWFKIYGKIALTGEPLHFENEARALNRWYEVYAYRVGKPEDRHVAIVFNDISVRRKAEEELRKAHDSLELRVQERTAELEQAYETLQREMGERKKTEEQLLQSQKMEALGTLTGGIAHDFNNILSAIIGFAEMAADDVLKEGITAHSLQRVLQASSRGRDLIKQMLTFSRKTEAEKKPLRLSSLINETMKLIRASIPTTISIRVNLKNESALILADLTQIQQVLMNLCTNAAYAMGEQGGVLDVELNEIILSDEKHDQMKPGSYLKLVIRDTGVGIPPEHMDKIFDPFFTTKQVGEGTGLGLSVVHGIVNQHDGHITVESEPGKGAVFSLYFPKIIEEPSKDAVIDEMTPGGQERILFIDDEELLMEMGQMVLERLGYEVVSATSSSEALSLFRNDPAGFDLVITDQTMPEMTGVELAKAILAIRPDIPVILCTGFSHLVDAKSAEAAGIRDFAMKPMTKREIAKTIRKVLDE
jgi:PAS domain S-box-containing protein